MWIKWNLYNETRRVLLKTHKFHDLPGTVLTKSCLERPPVLERQNLGKTKSLSWKTTCLGKTPNLTVALYRFHCICLCFLQSINDKDTDTNFTYVCWTSIQAVFHQFFDRCCQVQNNLSRTNTMDVPFVYGLYGAGGRTRAGNKWKVR